MADLCSHRIEQHQHLNLYGDQVAGNVKEILVWTTIHTKKWRLDFPISQTPNIDFAATAPFPDGQPRVKNATIDEGTLGSPAEIVPSTSPVVMITSANTGVYVADQRLSKWEKVSELPRSERIDLALPGVA
jgi:hypothetical protein